MARTATPPTELPPPRTPAVGSRDTAVPLAFSQPLHAASAEPTQPSGVETSTSLAPPHFCETHPRFGSDPFWSYTREVILPLYRERLSDPTRQPWIALLASQSWASQEWLESFLEKLTLKYPGAPIVHTGRRGAQKALVERAERNGHRLVEVKADGGGVQPLHVLMVTDILMCFWAGSNDTAKSVLEAAKYHRPDERFYPGVHVYEELRTRKTKSGGGGKTGEVRHRIRHSFSLVEPDEAEKRIKREGRL